MQVKVDVKFMQTNMVGMASPVFEILFLQKWPKFPFRSWYSPWGSKNKMCSKVEVKLKCMHLILVGMDSLVFSNFAFFVYLA